MRPLPPLPRPPKNGARKGPGVSEGARAAAKRASGLSAIRGNGAWHCDDETHVIAVPGTCKALRIATSAALGFDTLRRFLWVSAQRAVEKAAEHSTGGAIANLFSK